MHSLVGTHYEQLLYSICSENISSFKASSTHCALAFCIAKSFTRLNQPTYLSLQQYLEFGCHSGQSITHNFAVGCQFAHCWNQTCKWSMCIPACFFQDHSTEEWCELLAPSIISPGYTMLMLASSDYSFDPLTLNLFQYPRSHLHYYHLANITFVLSLPSATTYSPIEPKVASIILYQFCIPYIVSAFDPEPPNE